VAKVLQIEVVRLNKIDMLGIARHLDMRSPFSLDQSLDISELILYVATDIKLEFQ
jgi:hypothetical protein